jgi:hypothetical protein
MKKRMTINAPQPPLKLRGGESPVKLCLYRDEGEL